MTRIGFIFLVLLMGWGSAPVLSADEVDSPARHATPHSDQESRIFELRALGQTALEQGLYDEAIAYFEMYQALVHNFPELAQEAVNLRVDAMLRKGDVAGVEAMLPLFQKTLSPVRMNLLQARLALLKNQNTKAIIFLDAIPDTLSVPDKAEWLVLKITVYQNQKAWSSALASCKELEKLLVISPELHRQWNRFLLFRTLYFLIRSGQSGLAEVEIAKVQPQNIAERCELFLLSAMAKASTSQLYEAERLYKEARALPPFFENVLSEAVALELATRFLGINQPTTALTFLEDALRSVKTHEAQAEVMRRIIDAHQKSGDVSAEILARTQYIRMFPQNADAVSCGTVLANLQYDAKQRLSAFETFQYMLDSVQMNAENRLKVQRSYSQKLFESQNYKKARSVFKVILAENPQFSDTMRGEIMYREVECFRKEKSEKDARQALENLCQNSVWAERAEFELMLSYMNHEQYAMAMVYCERLGQKCTDSNIREDVLFYKADILGRQHDADSALAAFDSYLSLQPPPRKHPIAFFEAGRIAYAKAYYDRADSYFSSLLKRYPKSEFAPEAQYYQIYVAYLLNKEDSALNIARDLVKHYPKTKFATESIFWMANYYASMRDYTTTVSVLEELLDHPDMRQEYSRAHIERARALRHLNRSVDAIETILPLLKDSIPANLQQEINFMAGDILSSQNIFDSALIYYKAAYALDSQNMTGIYSAMRMGDCLCALFSSTADFDPAQLEAATTWYEQLLARPSLSNAFREEVYWKYGHILQLRQKDGKALSAFLAPLLMRAAKSSTAQSDVWVVKSANSALQILKKDASPAAIQKALQITRMMLRLEIAPISHWQKIQTEIEAEYGNSSPALPTLPPIPDSTPMRAGEA